MRPPRDRNSPINQARKDSWLGVFRNYRTEVTENRIDEWIAQFDAADRDIAARVLDVVEFFGPPRIASAYRAGLAALPGWHIDPSRRNGSWRFVAMSSDAGDSGDSMLHHFKLANRLDRREFRGLFARPSELLQQGLGADDSVVLIDDFVGTGNQVVTAWEEGFSELLAGVGNVYLMVVAARIRGVQRVQERTDLSVHCDVRFDDSDDLFSNACGHFTPAERTGFRRYCETASSKNPAGYGNCGLVVVFSHRCPNTTVSALHAWHPKWAGLFPRHDMAASP